MSESKFKENLNEYFSGHKIPSKEQLYELMADAKEAFQEIKAKMETGDPALKEDAVIEAFELKQLLEMKLMELSRKTGLRPDQLLAIEEQPNMLSRENRETLETARNKIADPLTPPPAAPKRPKKSAKLFA